MTEGDVITIFSQYGELLDINLPRIPEGGLRRPGGADREEPHLTPQQRQQHQGGKPGDRRGFGFLLYEDQRSTVLAVDNLNGSSLLGRTLRVDHVRDYKMPDAKRREEAGEEIGPSRNAAPQMVGARDAAGSSDEGEDDNDDLDAEDPMAAYFRDQKKKAKKEGKSDAESKAERRRLKEERRRRKEERDKRRAERATRGTSHDRNTHGARDHRSEREERDRHRERMRSRSPDGRAARHRYAGGKARDGSDDDRQRGYQGRYRNERLHSPT